MLRHSYVFNTRTTKTTCHWDSYMCTLYLDLPKAYKEGYREILQAEASVVDLHKLGPYYYMFGTLLLEFKYRESPDIAASLLNVRHLFIYFNFKVRGFWK